MTVTDLPTLNAFLYGLAGVLLVIGFFQIKRGRIAVHRRFMIAAFATSALFLVFYTIYHVQVGSRPFPGTGPWRTVYFSILIPHVILAAAVTGGAGTHDAEHALAGAHLALAVAGAAGFERGVVLRA